MKKQCFLVLSVSLLALPLLGCREQENSRIYLYDGSSRFVVHSLDDEGSIVLPTYRSSDTGEVPYVELGDFFYAAGALADFKASVSKVDKGYRVSDDAGHVLLTVDPEKDTFQVENYEHWAGRLSSLNNGVGPDVSSSNDDDESAVHTSPLSKYIGERKAELYELSPYHFDCVESGDKCYVPTQLLSTLFFRWNPGDLLYNGADFYFSNAVLSGTLPVITQSYFANKDRFMATLGVDAVRVDPVGQESYRYAYSVNNEYRIVSLTNDGKGQLLTASSASEKGEPASIDGISYTYAWKKQGDALYVNVFVPGKDPVTGEERPFPQGTFKIPLKNTFYGTKKRPSAIANFSYDLLRFQFDRFYGIKDVAGFTDFDAYIKGKGLKDRLLSLDSAAYDEALAELLMKNIDDGHTHYALPSIFTGAFTDKAKELVNRYSGTRRNNLFAKLKEYGALRSKAYGEKEGEAANLQGLFTQGDTAVIRFDQYAVPGMFVSNMVESSSVKEGDPAAAFAEGNVPLGFDISFHRISQNKDVKNVVVDLTCNGGGAVAAIPYIMAHFSIDPTLYFADTAMGITKEFHYKVDLNHDKKYGEKEDTYQGKYNFYILTSAFSFSCASFTPTLAHVNGAKVIGEKSGGGACTVGGFSDGSGSSYNVSSPQVCVYPNGQSFAHYDAGVPVDYALSSDSWYDLGKLSAFLGQIAK